LSIIRILLIVFGVLFFPIILLAQYDDERLLVFEDEFKKSFKSKPKVDVKFDNRFSFIRDTDVKTIGIKVGLNFRRKFKVGLGFNQMLFNVEKVAFDEIAGVNRSVELEYSYFSPYIEYVYYNTRKWEFSLSFQHGIGGASYQYTNANGKKVKLINSLVLSYEPAMLIDYKIIRWVGIGTGIGYRMVYYKEPGIKEKFSSPEYVIKLKIYLGEIVRSITGKENSID
jgi:hypothetical protein